MLQSKGHVREWLKLTNSKFGQNSRLHVLHRSLNEFRRQEKRWPNAGVHAQDIDKMKGLVESEAKKYSEVGAERTFRSCLIAKRVWSGIFNDVFDGRT